jgi:hypothetical protein
MDTEIKSIDRNDSFAGYLVASRTQNYNVNKINISFDQFCVNFLNTIINNSHKSLKNHIETLINLLKELAYPPKYKVGVHYAAKSVLLNKSYIKYINKDDETKDIYGSFRGFFLLGYVPRYSYSEILDIITQEGHSLKAVYSSEFYRSIYGS